MFSKTTHGITISVASLYLDDQSDPDEAHYVWAYTVHIENNSDRTVQLLRRRWQLTDALGQQQVVKGAGVVGEQPVMKPGEGFQYTSGTVLSTSSGYMVGTYQMAAGDERFEVDIPAFSLDSPLQVRRPN